MPEPFGTDDHTDPSFLPSAEGTTESDGEFLREERAALRRIQGLSTELEDITEVEYRKVRLEQVVLAGVWSEGTTAEAEESMTELARLAETAGAQVRDALIQRRERPDPATFLGSGKVHELKQIVQVAGADTVICDGELSPGQLRQLEDRLGVKVVDRTGLILDIFAQHARSREGKAQVALAQYEYLLTRLRGWGGQLSRQSGGRVAGGAGIGSRGPGETRLETNRRRIRQHMSRLRRELAQMERSRQVQRSKRRRSRIPSVALVGYTNAGKSSLLNALTGTGVLVDDELFATLDPVVRQVELPDGKQFTLTDTVGFVRHLPHQLVEAFRSTLEEVHDADVLLHVVDASQHEPESQMAAVRTVLAELGVSSGRELVVFNKSDAATPEVLQRLRHLEPEAVTVSAHTRAGLPELLEQLTARLPQPTEQVWVLIPYERGDVLARIHEHAHITFLSHEPTGTKVQAEVFPELAAQLAPFALAESE